MIAETGRKRHPLLLKNGANTTEGCFKITKKGEVVEKEALMPGHSRQFCKRFSWFEK